MNRVWIAINKELPYKDGIYTFGQLSELLSELNFNKDKVKEIKFNFYSSGLGKDFYENDVWVIERKDIERKSRG